MALARELFLKGERKLVVYLVQVVININLSFIGQVDKLGFKLVKALSLVYTHLLIFTLSFAYIIRVNKVFSKVVNYLGSYLEGISSIRLITSIQVALSVSISSIKDIIYTSILICEMVSIDLEFANNLDLLVVIGRAIAITKLCRI